MEDDVQAVFRFHVNLPGFSLAIRVGRNPIEHHHGIDPGYQVGGPMAAKSLMVFGVLVVADVPCIGGHLLLYMSLSEGKEEPTKIPPNQCTLGI